MQRLPCSANTAYFQRRRRARALGSGGAFHCAEERPATSEPDLARSRPRPIGELAEPPSGDKRSFAPPADDAPCVYEQRSLPAARGDQLRPVRSVRSELSWPARASSAMGLAEPAPSPTAALPRRTAAALTANLRRYHGIYILPWSIYTTIVYI